MSYVLFLLLHRGIAIWELPWEGSREKSPDWKWQIKTSAASYGAVKQVRDPQVANRH